MWNPKLAPWQVAVIAGALLVGCGTALYRYITTPARHPDWKYPKSARLYHSTVIKEIRVTHTPLVTKQRVVEASWQPPKTNMGGISLPTLDTPESRDVNRVEGVLKAQGVPFALPDNPDEPPSDTPTRLSIHIEIGGRADTVVKDHPTWGMLFYKVTLRRKVELDDGVAYLSEDDIELLYRGRYVGICSPEAFPARRAALLREVAQHITRRWRSENPARGKQP
jgi:hypothetical protein